MKTRWGILGLGKIAHTFVEDLKSVEHAELFAVASRTQSKADEFAKTHHATHAFGSYDDLFKHPDVDVIYIATPHVFHYENTLNTLQHHKAVLCEKPLAMNAQEVKEMQDLAKQNKVFFMEALWTNFMPSVQFLKDVQNNQVYGKLKYLKAEFCFQAEFDKTNRLFNKALGGGALLDIGIYPVYLALKLMGTPDKILAKAQFNETGVDVATNITFKYNNDTTADLFCSLNKSTESEADLDFEKAKITLHERFHESDKLTITSDGEEILKDFKHQHRGYHFEIEHVHDCLEQKLIESPIMTHQFSLELISTLDSIRELIGLKY